MGGCSLRCAFGWETVAITSSGAKPTSALDDYDTTTAWTGAAPGARLEFRFPKKLPAELNDTPFYGFDLANGAPSAQFKDYGRIKKIRASYNGKVLGEIKLADTHRWQKITFDDIMVRAGGVFTLEILELYPGEKLPTAALTEITLEGAH